MKMNREKASIILNTSRKTLNDYLLYLRYGRYYGFDFRVRASEGMGKLRNFVAQKKKENKQKGDESPVSFIK